MQHYWCADDREEYTIVALAENTSFSCEENTFLVFLRERTSIGAIGAILTKLSIGKGVKWVHWYQVQLIWNKVLQVGWEGEETSEHAPFRVVVPIWVLRVADLIVFTESASYVASNIFESDIPGLVRAYLLRTSSIVHASLPNGTISPRHVFKNGVVGIRILYVELIVSRCQVRFIALSSLFEQ